MWLRQKNYTLAQYEKQLDTPEIPMTRHKLLYYSLQLLAASALLGTEATWNLTGDGDWDVSGNWNPATAYPNGSNDIAHFAGVITNDALISLSNTSASTIRVNSITFDHPSYSYTIQQGSYDASTLNVTNITIAADPQFPHTITAPIVARNLDTLLVTNNSTSDFTLSGNISRGSSITFNGQPTGRTVISGTIEDNVSLETGRLYLNNSSVPSAPAIKANIIFSPNTSLQLGQPNQFSINSHLLLQNNCTFDMNGYSTEIQSIVFYAGSTLNQGGATLSLNSINTSLYPAIKLASSVTISGPIAFIGSGDWAEIENNSSLFATISGPITLPSTLTTGVYFNGSCSGSSTALFVTGQITGDSGAKIDMYGSYGVSAMEMGGSVSNDYTGDTSVINGTLYLNKSSSHIAIPANTTLTIGSVNGGTVFHRQSGQIAPTVAVVMQNLGTWNLNSCDESIKSLAGTGSILLGSGTLTIGGATDTNYSGSIEGTGGMLVKNGAGTLTLSGTNTYTGSTTVNDGGTLSLASGATLTSNVTLNDLSTLQFNNTDSLPFSNGIAGTGGMLVKNGAGTLTLSGTNSYTGSTTVNDGGTLSLASGTSLTSDVTLNDLSTLQFNNAASLPFSNGIAGTGGKLVKNGAGTLTLSGTNTYTGSTTVNDGGTLSLASGATLTSNVTLNDSSTLQFNNAGSLSFSYGIAGTGGKLISNGTGTLTLSGNHFSYTGTTTVNNGGTLSLASDATLTSNVTLNNSSTLQFDNTDSLPFSNDIAGNGNLVKNRVGTLTLSGTNTYTGSTTVNRGTLSLASGTSLTSDVTLYNSSTLQFNNAGPLSFSYGIAGTDGKLVKNGVGKLTLSGNVFTYAGSTTVNGGTLDFFSGASIDSNTIVNDTGTLLITANGSIGSGKTVTLNSGGKISFNTSQVSPITFSNAISGVGNLETTGPETLELSGNNFTYTGSTTVNNGGTLSLISGATLTSDVTLNDSSTLQFNNAGSLSFSNAIIGSGGNLIKRGAGKLTLSGTNTYDGSTTVYDGGTLSLASGTTLASDVTLNNLSILQFNNDDPLTFSKTIEGTGGKLYKYGSGTLTFTTAQTYTGKTYIYNGALALASGSSLDSNVNVGSASGGTLKGVGTINNNVVVLANGTVHPGNSIGTLTITGDYTTSGVTEIEIDPNGTCSKLVVNGSVALGGELLIDVPSGFYSAGTSYEIISAQTGLTGNFDFVTSHLNGSVYKQDTSSPYQVFYIINSDHHPGIDTTGLRGNRLIVANYLNANSELVGETLSLLHELSGQPLQDALDTISPARDAITTTISQNTNFTLSNILDSRNNDDRVMRMISKERDTAFLANNSDIEIDELTACSRAQVMDRLPKRRPLPRPKNHSLWATGFGDFTHQEEQHQVPEFNSTSGGLLIGGDFTFGRTTLGAALAYTHASIHEKQHFGHAAINSGLLSIYSTVELNRFFIEGALWGGMQHTENERNIFFPGFDATARSSYNSFQGDAHLSSGCYYSFLPGILEPFISVDWACNRDSAYNEQSASPFNMNRSEHFSSALRSEAGLNGYFTRDRSWGTFFLRGKASYVNLIPFQVGHVTAFLTGAPSSFTVTSFTKTQNLIAAAVEFFCQHRSGWFGSLQYDGQYGSSYSNNQATMRVGKMF